MGFRLRDEQEMQVGFTIVLDAVFGAFRDVDRLTGINSFHFSFDLKSSRTRQDIEYLLRMVVVMQLFGSAGRHAFLYHA